MEMLRDLFSLFASSAAIGSLVFFVPLWAPRVVFGASRGSWQKSSNVKSYSLTDLFVVISFLACGNAILSAMRQDLPQGVVIFQVLCLDTLVLAIWIQCQQFMRAWAIDHTRRRMLTQVVFYPVAILTIGQILFTSVMLASLLSIAAQEGLPAYVQNPLVWTCGITLCVAATLATLARLGFLALVVDSAAQNAVKRKTLIDKDADAQPLSVTQP